MFKAISPRPNIGSILCVSPFLRPPALLGTICLSLRTRLLRSSRERSTRRTRMWRAPAAVKPGRVNHRTSQRTFRSFLRKFEWIYWLNMPLQSERSVSTAILLPKFKLSSVSGKLCQICSISMTPYQLRIFRYVRLKYCWFRRRHCSTLWPGNSVQSESWLGKCRNEIFPLLTNKSNISFLWQHRKLAFIHEILTVFFVGTF
jgi:hypothetical protein